MVGAVGGGGRCPGVVSAIDVFKLDVTQSSISPPQIQLISHLPAPFPPRANHDPSTRLCD
jgi:hypothetical protein